MSKVSVNRRLTAWVLVILMMVHFLPEGLTDVLAGPGTDLATATDLVPEVEPDSGEDIAEEPAQATAAPSLPEAGEEEAQPTAEPAATVSPEETEETGEQPSEEEDPESGETEEEEPEEDGDAAREAVSNTFSVELHTGTAYGGKGTRVTAAKNVASVKLSRAAGKLFSVQDISGKTFRIMPLKRGKTTITVYYTDGKKQTYTVSVYDKYIATGITLTFSNATDGTALLMQEAGRTSKTTCKLTPSTAKDTVTYKSSNTRIAKVDSATGVITMLKEGSFTLTATASGGAKVKVKMRVVNPYGIKTLTLQYNGTSPSGKTTAWSTDDKLTLSFKAVTWGGSKYPADAKAFVWSTSSSKIATIDQKGRVTVKKSGTVTFTLKGPGGKKAAIRFKLVPALKSVSIGNSASVEVKPGKTVKLKSSLSPSASSPLASLKWYSADEKIAKVDQKGVVTGVKNGTTWIYCKDTVTGLYARKSVVVSYPATYRAIVVVEPTDLEDVAWQEGSSTWYLNGYLKRTADLNGIVKTLQLQSYNGHRWRITKLWKTSSGKVTSAISKVASQANEHDVTLFFFMGHGDNNGGLHFYNGSYISSDTLKKYLDKIPGKVIVMLGSCYSGTYVTRGDDGSGFTGAVISAFAEGDSVPVTYLDENGAVKTVTQDMLQDALAEGDEAYAPRNGELRQSKYYVLTASGPKEQAWSSVVISSISYRKCTFTANEGESYSYFVRGVCRAGGYDSVEKTRLWSSGQRTLAQVYSSVYQYCRSGSSKSKVQVYPSGSSFVIFQQ